MKILFQIVMLSAMLSLSEAVSAQAVTPDTGAKTAAATSGGSAQQQQLYRSSKIIGSNVRDLKDRKIGQIKDLVLDGGRGEVAYAIVNFGGVMGVGRKFHAIPWQALQPSDNGRYYVLNADKETINLAPGFDKAKWPDMADKKWSAEIDRYWSRMVGRGNPGNDLSSGSSNGAAAASGAR